ncbi:MAG: hypothetical protein EOO72_00965 [Myxococcaceae bacterium]|nr:MAG: hypothetical protein EOO72_00965 [Myxococcaceae bacterium]
MRCRRPRTPAPEVQQHRANRQEYFRDLDKLKGLADPTPSPRREVPLEQQCPTCGGPTFTTSYGRVCSMGLHDG